MKKYIGGLIKKYFRNNILFGIFCVLFLVLLVTRFYEPETKSGFGFDQVDNAWAAKNIIIDRNFPLTGMQAKGNTGFYIGPYYYYFLVPFYFLTGMDPIASSIAAGLTSIFTFLVIYFVTRGIFNEKVAIFAIFINVFSSYIIELDRIQWPVNFIVPLSFLILFSIYKICSNKPEYFLLLAVSFGFSLHIHFTSIFYIVFFILSIPFIPRNKNVLRYILYSLPIFLFFIFPIVLNYFLTKSGSNAVFYIENTFHGFHLRRLLQIIGDGFIEFNAILTIPNILIISILAFLSFSFILLHEKMIKKNFVFVYLISIWVIIPWIAFSTYSGEITNYYFGITRPVAILTFAYLLYLLTRHKKIYSYFLLSIILGYYIFINLSFFSKMNPSGLSTLRPAVLDKISKGETIEFVHGDPKSYLYYIYKEKDDR